MFSSVHVRSALIRGRGLKLFKEITISHSNFIESVWEAANRVFPNESIDMPEIRVSHIIKGRTPEAIHKSVKDLLEEDKTIYYERMMFCFEVPTIHEDIMGNRLNLTIGGVRAYNHENLYSKKGIEKFKVFIGFKNMVCCNMCVSTDGYKSELKVMSINDLFSSAMQLFQEYNISKHLYYMGAFKDSYMTVHQFAQFLGKSRLYQYLLPAQKKKLPQMLMTDTQALWLNHFTTMITFLFLTIKEKSPCGMCTIYSLEQTSHPI